MQFTIISLKNRLVKRFLIKNFKKIKKFLFFSKKHSVNVKMHRIMNIIIVRNTVYGVLYI